MRRRHLVAALVALASVSAGVVPPLRASAVTGTSNSPNILIIVTDDQRGGLGYMPATRRWIENGGTRFDNGFVTTPLCCPSRASIMTGRYAHNHHVFNNDSETANLVQRSTLQYYLTQAGYHTGIYGKYLNGWGLTQPPPYFDDYAIIGTGGYKDGTWDVNGSIKTISRYNTTYIGDKAQNFLDSAGSSSPWFLYLATAPPHAPYRPQTKFARAHVAPWTGNPAVFEKDRSDKPPYVRNWHGDLAYGDAIRRAQFRTLMSVDTMVNKVFSTLTQLGEERNTLVFFIADNALMWGEHGLKHKKLPYEQDIRVPFMVRWPGHFPAGARDSRLAANIDIAPTVLDAAGITPDPAYPIDGRSLLSGTHRPRLLTEEFGPTSRPGWKWARWASTQTKGYSYTEYYGPDASTVLFREYYDLKKDPWQLHNLLGDANASNDPNVAALSAQLNADRTCEGTTGPNACP